MINVEEDTDALKIGRRRYVEPCRFCGVKKKSYKSRHAARRAIARAPAKNRLRVYPCEKRKGIWHLTKQSKKRHSLYLTVQQRVKLPV